MAPLVYILVLNYCSAEDALACIEAVRQLDYANYRLLVLDNASPDGSGDELRKWLSKEEFLQLPTNTGYAGGNNAGMRIALDGGADYLLIVNPDVRLLPDSVACYVETLEQDRTIAALNAIQVGADSNTIDLDFRNGVLRSIGMDAERLDARYFPATMQANTLYGAALMIRASSIRRVGGFDPLYFAYGEEIDLCRRMIFHGMRLVVTSRAPVVHLRTIYKSRLSDFVLFLIIKGYYLSRLKAPNNSMLLTLKEIMSELLPAALGKPGNMFPFTRYPLKAKHAAKTVIWLTWNLLRIRRHREQEKRGRCYV
jgi:hypothetical protein